MAGKEGRARSNPAEGTRANIIEVATAEFVDKGLAGARIDVIAEKTHSSKRMIYYYFGGKDELYRAVLEQAYAGIREAEQRLDVAALPPEEALRALVRHSFDYHFDHPDFVRLVMNENVLHGAHINRIASIKERNRPVIAILGDILARGSAAGVFRDGVDPLSVHLAISALCFHPVSNRYTLAANFGVDLGSPEARARRFEEVAAAVLAFVRR